MELFVLLTKIAMSCIVSKNYKFQEMVTIHLDLLMAANVKVNEMNSTQCSHEMSNVRLNDNWWRVINEYE